MADDPVLNLVDKAFLLLRRFEIGLETWPDVNPYSGPFRGLKS